MLHAVIMAGGSGTRFWPRSTQEHPKQFLNLFGDRTMLQNTVDRISGMIPEERILVITNSRYVDLVQKQIPRLPAENIIGEPVARNTAPCVAYAAALLHSRDPDASMIVLPADHLVADEKRFRSIVKTAAAKARQDCLVTIGITPDRPETGYGYIQFEPDSGETLEDNEVRRVRTFTEKPDRETAETFIEEGTFLWNSGMFVWHSSTITEQFAHHQPDIYKQMEQLSNATNPHSQESVGEFYEACPSISIDYGIMEHADTVFVVPGEFGWNDVGSWKAVYDLREKDEEGNVVQTRHLQAENAANNLVQSDSGKVIALVGVENLAVVETDDAILVCNLDEAQGVKQIVESLEKRDKLKKFL